MRPRKTPPIPKSLLRDLNLYVLQKHHPALARSIVRSRVQYLPRKKIIRATIDFDPETYLALAERKP
jgi:hypothetical protein